MDEKSSRVMWLIIIIVFFAAIIAGVSYMVISVGKFSGIQALSGGKRWLRNLISIAVIFIVLGVIAVLMTPVNSGIVFLNAVMFFLLFDLIFRLTEKLTGKAVPIDMQGFAAIITTVIYLSVGYYLCVNVWQTDYTLKTDKNIGTLKAALFADSHIGATFDGEGFAKHIKTIEQQSPDIVLIAGDFVDDTSKKADLEKACEALGRMNVKYGVWFSYGNHDKGYYSKRDFSAEDLESIMKANNIHILQDDYELIDDRFYIVGRSDISLGERKDMNTLLEGADTSKYIIVMDHEPNDFENESKSDADLVLSGHTHGGQMFPIKQISDLFKINDRCYGYEKRNGTEFIVTSGISDWDLKFKTGTKSEYVILNISG